MKNNIIILLLLIFISIILTNCGNEPPIIKNTKYNILIYEKGSFNISNNSIFLSVYFILNDENGMEDIKEIKIIHSDTDYTWILPQEIINIETVWNEQTYIGFSFLEYSDAKKLLLGEYVIAVEDKAGNFSEDVFYVELDENKDAELIDIPEIKYKVDVENKKELKISGDNYSSCEIRFLNDPSFFNGGRKKFKKGKKIILSKEEVMPEGTNISVRINKDDEEKIVYFLNNIVL